MGLTAEILLFALFAVVSVISAVGVVVIRDPVKGAMSLIACFFSLACLFLLQAAELIAVLEVLVYAGAIMVLFVFVIMLLNQGPQSAETERQWLSPRTWVGPSVLAGILFIEMVVLLQGDRAPLVAGEIVGPREVAVALFGQYILVIELASLLLLAGLIGAYHLGRREDGQTQAGER